MTESFQLKLTFISNERDFHFKNSLLLIKATSLWLWRTKVLLFCAADNFHRKMVVDGVCSSWIGLTVEIEDYAEIRLRFPDGIFSFCYFFSFMGKFCYLTT